MREYGVLACLLFLALGPGEVSAQEDCGPLSLGIGSGPYDYRSTSETARFNLQLAEGAHFPPYVEALVKGKTATTPGPDIAFVLYVFPNHHRALRSVSKLAIKEKKPKPTGVSYSVECYFDRAVRMALDDGMVRLLHGMYLAELGKHEQALAMYKEAERLMPESISVAYNLGLLYFELKDYDRSLEYAKKAYARGVSLPGLKDKLAKVGKWRSDPAVPAAAATAGGQTAQDAPSEESHRPSATR